MAATATNPFNLTAAGELGDHRESMLYNELLLRVSEYIQHRDLKVEVLTSCDWTWIHDIGKLLKNFVVVNK